MKFILLDTERRGGLKIRHHGHIGFSVVLIFDSRKGELVRGLVLIFKNRIRSIEWCERFAVWLFSEFHFFLACSGRVGHAGAAGCSAISMRGVLIL
ncbi:MAG: hypothetical protein DMG54_03185 [Acidobacteria bacterium]|nr:MAG: hypothetical protein DMG54_03185 [Acidobacteriota bacterium]PYU68850.1 MAG: hypothetical protein DMG52_30390 [Acidobacteriota bacterium]